MNPNHDPATGQFTSGQEESAALRRARGEHLRVGAGRPITPAAIKEAERKWTRTAPAKVRAPRIPKIPR